MNPALIANIAALANIPITEGEEKKLADGFVTTLKVVDKLLEVDTKGIEPTHQVTGLENIWREDVVDDIRTFSQEEALANASQTQDGYFYVAKINP